jgi:CRISPR-associated protein Cmr2
LLLVDVDQIHNYVFESAKLAEMRGASLILDLLNVGGLEEAEQVDVRVDELPIRGIGEVIREAGLDPEINVIYSGGGAALLALPPDRAPAIQAGIEEVYLRTTLTTTVTTVCKSVTMDVLENGFPPPNAQWVQKLSNAGRLARQLAVGCSDLPTHAPSPGTESRPTISGFGQVLAALNYEARRAKDAKRSAPLFEVSPFSERCAFCHYRPAFKRAEEIDEHPICLACNRKRDAGDKQSGHGHYLKSLRQYLESAEGPTGLAYLDAVRDLAQAAKLTGDPWVALESPPDLEAIGEDSKGKARNYLGIIYADGNEMGTAIESVRSADELRLLSDTIRWSIKTAVFSGLAKYISGPRTVKRERGRGERSARLVPIHYHPFEIVSIGGDDVYLFVPSDIALELASHICAEFSAEFRRRARVAPDLRVSEVSMSAGVLIAQVSTPIYFTRQIVEGLLKSAKAKSKSGADRKARPAIDYQVITTDTAITGDIAAFRETAYANRFPAERLTTRPLYLEELNELISTIRRLKSDNAAQSQLYQLREAVALGPQPRASNFYNYQRSRNEKLRKAYAPLHAMLSRGDRTDEYLPFWKEGDQTATPIPDIVEAYNFILADEKRSEHENEDSLHH